MLRHDLLLRDCAACAGTVVGVVMVCIGGGMVFAALFGFLIESFDLGLSVRTELAWKIELTGSGVLATFFGLSTYLLCVEEIPEWIRIVVGAFVALAAVALLSTILFLSFEPMFGCGWAVVIVFVFLGVATTCKRPKAFHFQ